MTKKKEFSAILFVQGLLELSVVIFIIGILFGYPSLVIIGGILMAVSDLLDMLSGALNPVFPILLALFLGTIINPWWLGVFWSLAVFHILGLPSAILKILKGIS